MNFKSRKDIFIGSITIGLNTFLIGLIIFDFTTNTSPNPPYWAMILVVACAALLFWFYFGTSYNLSNEYLFYKSGPLNGKVEISKITEIIKGKTSYIGLKPATARNGLVIKYNKYDEIYISPDTNELFIEKILELNREIKIS